MNRRGTLPQDMRSTQVTTQALAPTNPGEALAAILTDMERTEGHRR